MTIKLEVGKKYRNRRGDVLTYLYDIGSRTIFRDERTRVILHAEKALHTATSVFDWELTEVTDDFTKKPHKHAKLIKAWADGAEIQGRLTGSDAWVDLNKPSWNGSDMYEYRIKPEPRPEPRPDVVEFYVKMPFQKRSLEGADYEWVGENGKKCPQLKVIWDGTTGELKDAEVIK